MLAIGTIFSGIVVGALRGWAISLCILATAPVIGVCGYAYNLSMTAGSSKNLVAYSQSAGYAEQAMSAIRVVIAFGQENTEVQNYTKYLERARVASIKNHRIVAICVGGMYWCIYCLYSYAFWIGSLFVEEQVHNDNMNKPYSAGDVIGCFFAVLIGLFSFAMVGSQTKCIVDAKVAAKFAFEVIEREPSIKLDDPKSEKHTLKGDIELHNVVFYYPTRPDAKVLNNLSCKFP